MTDSPNPSATPRRRVLQGLGAALLPLPLWSRAQALLREAGELEGPELQRLQSSAALRGFLSEVGR